MVVAIRPNGRRVVAILSGKEAEKEPQIRTPNWNGMLLIDS